MKPNPYSIRLQNLRMCALVGVILHHAAFGVYANTNYRLSYFCYLNLLNFGSILFILISGYFFQQSINKYAVKELIIKKTKSITLPYLAFVIPWILFEYFIAPNIGRQQETITLAEVLERIFLKTNYWFIINLIVVQSINFLFIKLKHWKLLLFIFSLFTAFYSANIYYQWLITAHSYAFFGFISFFYLGRILYAHKTLAKYYFNKISLSPIAKVLMTLAMVLAYYFAIIEMKWIQQFAPKDDFTNVLRLSNIILVGIITFLLYHLSAQFKINRTPNSRVIFLIYLIHPYFLRIGSFISYFTKISFPDYDYKNIIINILYGIIILSISIYTSEKLYYNYQQKKRPATI